MIVFVGKIIFGLQNFGRHSNCSSWLSADDLNLIPIWAGRQIELKLYPVFPAIPFHTFNHRHDVLAIAALGDLVKVFSRPGWQLHLFFTTSCCYPVLIFTSACYCCYCCLGTAIEAAVKGKHEQALCRWACHRFGWHHIKCSIWTKQRANWSKSFNWYFILKPCCQISRRDSKLEILWESGFWDISPPGARQGVAVRRSVILVF